MIDHLDSTTILLYFLGTRTRDRLPTMASPPPSALYTPTFLLALLTTLLLCLTLRALAILPSRSPKPRLRTPGTPTRVVIVLGSGGHTQEMLYLLRDLDPAKYTHRTWVVSSGDAFSAGRAVAFESEMESRAGSGHGKNVGPGTFDVVTVPRARSIHQSLLTTLGSSLRCLCACFAPLLGFTTASSMAQAPTKDLPDLIVTNGPATACILVFAALLLRFFNVRGAQSRGKCTTVYAESFARVKTLSLSGKLLVRVVDRFLVQWEGLEGVGGGRAEFVGVLV
ncbi:hypothetical protein PMIN02_003367 [Paraphaeosphaeria minitans]